MRNEVYTGDWMIDAKINSMMLLAAQGFNEGEDFRLGVMLCNHIRQLIEMSKVVPEDEKKSMTVDITELESKIIVEWALFVSKEEKKVTAE